MSETPLLDRTTQNAVQASLLSLPVELRDMILKRAYGECKVVVSAGRETHLPPTMSLANERSAPGPVCQQFWQEASDAFYSSCDFVFDSPKTLRRFALSRSRYSVVSRVKRLTIEPRHRANNDLRSWAEELTASVVGRFHSLEGLRIIKLSAYPPGTGAQGDPTDVMHLAYWRRRGLADMIRAFQQHKLKADLTEVVLIDTMALPRYMVPPKYTPLGRAMRKELLKHTPVRRSNRLAMEAWSMETHDD